MKKTLILLWGLVVCTSVLAQTHPTTDKGCMILDQPGKRLARKLPGIAPGRMYRMSFKADLGDCDSLLAGANLQQSSTQWFFSSGKHQFTFTANDTTSLVFFYINAPCRVSICYVKIEEIRIESRIVCTEDSAGYRYGFNGKEKIDGQYGIEGTAYDYGFRVYDSRIARFLSVDPLSNSYPFYTPYQFAANTPIAAIDLDGEEMKLTYSIIGNKVFIGLSVQLSAVNESQVISNVEAQAHLSMVQKYFSALFSDKLKVGTYEVELSASINFSEVKSEMQGDNYELVFSDIPVLEDQTTDSYGQTAVVGDVNNNVFAVNPKEILKGNP